MSTLSVILTSYNYARYLPAALVALAAQTRPPDEVIVIDDGSADDSVAIINAFLGRFAAPLLVQNPRNLGTIANLNRGLELARGEVVYFAAADDVAYPALLERGMGLLDGHPGAALFSARSDIIDTEGRVESTLATAIPLPHPGYIAPDVVARILMRGRQLAHRQYDAVPPCPTDRRRRLRARNLGPSATVTFPASWPHDTGPASRRRCSGRGAGMRGASPGRRLRILPGRSSSPPRWNAEWRRMRRLSRRVIRAAGRAAICSVHAALPSPADDRKRARAVSRRRCRRGSMKSQ